MEVKNGLRKRRKEETKTSLRYWLGDEVLIKVPSIHGVIVQIRIEGTSDRYIIYYQTQYWIEGQMHLTEFSDIELELLKPHGPIAIGFRKE